MATNEYSSKYTDKKVSAAQKLAEFICERQADKQRKALTYRFWNLPEWKAVFLNQLRAAQSLLKLYTPEAIMAVLKQKRNVFSLRVTWLEAAYQAEQNKIDQAILLAQAAKPQNIVPVGSGEARPTFSIVKNPLKGL